MLMQLTDFFNSLPLRGVLAFFAALFLSLACGEKLIGFLHHHQAKGQPIREDGPQSHLLTKKARRPWAACSYWDPPLSACCFCRFTQFLRLDKHSGSAGLRFDRFCRRLCQSYQTDCQRHDRQNETFSPIYHCAGRRLGHYAVCPETGRFELSFPWFRSLALNLGWFYVPFAMIVIAGASNAVNLSDGLDGLASGLLIVSFLVLQSSPMSAARKCLPPSA